MIATLTGTVGEKIGDILVLDVAGVGYGVSMTTNERDRLTVGDKLKVYIYENIKEDTHALFGFTSIDNKQLFEQLLSVKNVGPKVAMNLLEIGTVNDVRLAIAGGDVKRLQSAKGVGKRAAEQIVVELRDKVGMLVTESAEDIVNRSGISATDEAAQALVALGYSELDATLALKNIEPDLPTEERIKLALRGA
jgi:Holliday junction DNA helicase RuvA